MRLGQRLRSALRRSTDPADVLQFADLQLCRRTRKVTRASRPIELTRTEFDLLEFFLSNPDRVLERTEIAEHVWGFDFGAGSNSMNVYVGYLRRKTEAGGEPRLIHTVRGVGYMLREA
jgi:two-component system, OmpR family, response regulator MprA